jgi:hypothetical protein
MASLSTWASRPLRVMPAMSATGARVGHRGQVAGGVDLRVVQHAQVPVDLDAAVVAGRQRRTGHQLGCVHPVRPDEHATLHQLAAGEPEAVGGRGRDRRVGADLHPKVRKHAGGLVDQLRRGAGQDGGARLDKQHGGPVGRQRPGAAR